LPWRELGLFSLGRSKRLPQDAKGKPITLVQVVIVQPSHCCLPGFFLPWCSCYWWNSLLYNAMADFSVGTVRFVGVC